MDKKLRIDELVEKLNAASNAYYGAGEEVLSNYEWDAMFDELASLETETGYIRDDSPTQTVSSTDEVIDGGEKERHEFPALSLQKSKKVPDIVKWAGDRDIWCALKLDGCTCVATYDAANDGTGDSVLTKFLTRGDGIIGTNITYLVPAILSLPRRIPNGGHVVVRGETLIRNDDFELLNATLGDDVEPYANARNFASGTLSLDASRMEEAKSRKCRFVAFNLIYMEQEENSWGARMDLLDKWGFETVSRSRCENGAAGLQKEIDKWTKKVETGKVPYPVDGLVVTFEDWAYANAGGNTGHHSRNGGFAFKWADESTFTTLDHIDWSCAAGSITPVAVFDPVELEGTTVSRASLCNISEMERLGIGADRKTKLEVIKANKIIPKCISVPESEGSFDIPETCPICHAPTVIYVSKQRGHTKTLHCTNPKCPAKHMQRFVRGVGKDVSKYILAAVGSDEFFARMKSGAGFEDIKNIGPEKSSSIIKWYADEENKAKLEHLLNEVTVLKAEPRKEGGACSGMTFVITGSVHAFKNRDAFKAWVEANGGTVAGSVSKKTTYLVNNDLESTSSKNKKANELGIPVISEDQFIEKFHVQF